MWIFALLGRCSVDLRELQDANSFFPLLSSEHFKLWSNKDSCFVIKVPSWGAVWFSFGSALAWEFFFTVSCLCSREDTLTERVTFSRISFFSRALWTVDSVAPLLSPSPILLVTHPPCMEMNSVLWIWGWRWGLQRISSPACKTTFLARCHVLQVLSSQPEFLLAITWPWIPDKEMFMLSFFTRSLLPREWGWKKLQPHTGLWELRAGMYGYVQYIVW